MTAETCFQRVKEHCLAKPGAYEDHPWDETVFKVKPKGKIFCFAGTANPVITVKSTPERQAGLVQDPNIKVAAYVGRYGWVTVNIPDEQMMEFALDLIDQSYALVAPRKRR